MAIEEKPILRFGGELAITPYAYCSMRCTYCSMDAQGRSRPLLSHEYIDHQLRQQLRAAKPRLSVLGNFADIYPLEEQALGISRHLLMMLAEENIPFSLVTKSDLVLRDVDILVEACTRVTISAGITDEHAVRRIEPLAPSFARRVETVEKLLAAGVAVRVSAMPWIPDISDTRVLIETLSDKTRVAFGALSLMEETREMREVRYGWQRKPSSLRAFGKSFTQTALNERYLAEAARYFERPNTAWAPPRNTQTSRRKPMCSVMSREDLDECLREYDVTPMPALTGG